LHPDYYNMEPSVKFTEIPTSLKAYCLRRQFLVKPGVVKPPHGKKKKGQSRQVGGERVVPVLKRFDEADFGDVPFNQSRYKTNRVFENIGMINYSFAGRNIWLRARLHSKRVKGSKLAFLVFRRGLHTIQCIASDKPIVGYCKKIYNESVVDLYGEVLKAEQPVESTTQSEVEIQVKKIYVLSLAEPELPFTMDDANRQPPKSIISAGDQDEEKVEPGHVSQKTRLDNRVIDLRTRANHAIFRIASSVCQYFRQYFLDLNFTEIHSPKICPGVSEGGTDVFKFKYFDKGYCCLAQSPQLYKQMAIEADLFNVFEIGHVFRAENSNTYRHLCEFTGLDFEMEIKEHYHEVLQVLANLFVSIFDNLNRYNQVEISAVAEQYPFTPLKYRPHNKTVVVDFQDAVKLLREAGHEVEELDDFSADSERHLGAIMKEKEDVDYYIVDKYPLNARPFYTMPCSNNPTYTNSYDVFIRSAEITSGAQRIHDVKLLKERAKAHKIPESGLKAYIDSFKYGAYPHGGSGTGLERVVMLFLGLDNIRKAVLWPRTPKRSSP